MRKRLINNVETGGGQPDSFIDSIWFYGYSTNPQSEWYPGNNIKYSFETITYPYIFKTFNISSGVEIYDSGNRSFIIQPKGTKHTDLIISEGDEIRMRFYHNGEFFTVDELLFNIYIKRSGSGEILNYGTHVSPVDVPYIFIPVNRTMNVSITNAIAGTFSISYNEQYLIGLSVYY